MNCPVQTCDRACVKVTDLEWGCPRCGARVRLPSALDTAENNLRRYANAINAAREFPLMRRAFFDWATGRAYWTGKRYRIKGNRKYPAWDRMAQKRYPDVRDFAEMARAVHGQL